jgi:hypothetical protein
MTRNPNVSQALVSIAKQNPARADVHINTALTGYSTKYANDRAGYGADNIAPVVGSRHATGYYWRYLKGAFFRDEMKLRGEGGDIPMAGYRLDKTLFGVDVWSVGKPIDDQVEDNADDPFDMDSDAAEFLTDLELIRRERAMASVAFVDSVWSTDITGNTSASAPGSSTVAQWDDDNADPLGDIAYYREYMKMRTGLFPNVLAIGLPVWSKLKNNASILARISGGSNNGNPATVTKELVASLMELDEIVVLSSVYNTDEETATDPMTGSWIVGKEGLLMHRNSSPGWKKPTALRTITWQRPGVDARGTRILRWPDFKPHVDVIEIESNFRHVVTASDLGIRFKTLVA